MPACGRARRPRPPPPAASAARPARPPPAVPAARRRSYEPRLTPVGSAGVQPEVLTYANAMNACAKNGHVQTVMRLLAEMRTDNLTPNAFCFNAAVRC